MSNTTYKRGELIRDRLDLDLLSKIDKNGELVEFAKNASSVTPAQVDLFRDLWQRQHDAEPTEATVEAFKHLPRRQAAALIDVIIGRQTLEDAVKEGAEPRIDTPQPAQVAA